ncbi:phosphoenolpyruvate--protein phosphotransferase [Salinibacterium amurskyense]|uniref:Phosphoenolpyruvate-protein phosphotransferase n=1 Tax=Salinibacterium amurskyense TaxID=205941 RepID=A0A2M9D3D8_9MICO|nr:phosphoenolpyruvate--protein phosphotransferase [Salinibacterium amurskyense]PJJ78518.1 phosphoenolpyruvate--protein phosphotransferase [Salinibacterium amurskyense]RLQ80612.1 phosphoenolpyruvate--protein phosphotransferase [Salinibacterium amurskyense]GHD83093.1 phosphoenolpyruvate-protein phosphotransferase [Salinibacterium amurskyense]
MELQGVGVGRSVAIGKVVRMPDPLPEPKDARHSGDAAAEKEAAASALTFVAADLRARAEKADAEANEVLTATALMAEDPSILDSVNELIDGGKAAERAVFEAFASFREMLISLGGMMAERATDLSDVSQRVVARLRGVEAPGVPQRDEPFVLVADDLAPADTALLELDKVLALVTRQGGPTSHTAILARSKAIPAIMGVAEALELADETLVIVDAGAGTITTEPTAEQVSAAEARIAELAAAANAPITDGALADGTLVPLLANLGTPSEAAQAVELGAEGVGLFRTELMFLDATSAPTVEEQTKEYTEMLQHFPGKKVVVRALDAGADKPLSFMDMGEEVNPALGQRGLRSLRVNENILRDQLTALVNAQNATDADLWVMAPMVSDAEETEYFVALGRELGLNTVGVMAEVPSLAVLADQVAERSDFVSIGSNDLTQYTLAADRMLGTLAKFQDPWHPAVLRMVKLLGDAGAAAGKPVGVCGEAAADPQLAIVLVGLGVTSLSMTPAALADVRAELLTVTLEQAKARAAAAINATTGPTAREAAAQAA